MKYINNYCNFIKYNKNISNNNLTNNNSANTTLIGRNSNQNETNNVLKHINNGAKFNYKNQQQQQIAPPNVTISSQNGHLPHAGSGKNRNKD